MNKQIPLTGSSDLILFYEQGTDPGYVRDLAQKLNLPVTSDCSEAQAHGIFLQLDQEGLALAGNGQLLRADLTHMLPRLRQDNLNRELLVRAAKLKHFTGTPSAVDATAGFGEDALLLAAAGFSVTLFERDPVIAALLGDSLRRAASVPELSAVVSRMKLVEGDSILALSRGDTGVDTSPVLSRMGIQPDVVLLDPMFPARQKSALVKKKFQLLHFLEPPCSDEEALLQAAISARPRRIVIKRPVKGPFLCGKKPSFSLSGKAVRYDVLVYAPEG